MKLGEKSKYTGIYYMLKVLVQSSNGPFRHSIYVEKVIIALKSFTLDLNSYTGLEYDVKLAPLIVLDLDHHAF